MKSIRYRGVMFKAPVAIFVVVFFVLGYLGTEPTTVWGQFGFDAFLQAAGKVLRLPGNGVRGALHGGGHADHEGRRLPFGEQGLYFFT